MMDSEGALPQVQEIEQEGVGGGTNKKMEVKNETKKKKKKRSSYFPRFGCFRIVWKKF